MTISTQTINTSLRRVSKSNTLLDMLFEFENVLDRLDLYAFKNWIYGEVLEGPNLSRHWVEVKLLYPSELMPDPAGANRLLDRNIRVKFSKTSLVRPVEVKSPEDVEVITKPDGTTKRKAKEVTEPVWVVKIAMPRRLVDEFSTELVAIGDGEYIDTEALNAEGELMMQSTLGGQKDGEV